MAKEDTLEVCKKCKNKMYDVHFGILCSLTQSPGEFGAKCPNFLSELGSRDHLSGNTPFVDYDLAQWEQQQNLLQGIIASLTIGLLVAAIWGTLSFTTEAQANFMALLVGPCVGLCMQNWGRGIDKLYGILGAAITFLCCLIGTSLSVIGLFAANEGIPFIDSLRIFDYFSLHATILNESGLVQLLLLSIATWQGYRLSVVNLRGY